MRAPLVAFACSAALALAPAGASAQQRGGQNGNPACGVEGTAQAVHT